MKAKIKIHLIEKHFFEFESFPMLQVLFPYGEIDTEDNRILLSNKLYFNSICTLCRQFNLKGYEYDLFAVSTILLTDKIDKDIGKPLVNEYDHELCEIFNSIVKLNPSGIKEDIIDLKVIINNRQIPISSWLKREIKLLILDNITEFLKMDRWEFLDTSKKRYVAEKVNQYLQENKTKRGAPKKNRSQYIGALLSYTKDIINSTETATRFESDRQHHLFVGKLAQLCEIIPKPDKQQKGQGDKYFIKAVENHLPKN